MQKDLGRLEQWVINNSLKLNKGKCRVLHLGWSNARHSYRHGDKRLESSSAGRNLGVLVDRRLNMSQ